MAAYENGAPVVTLCAPADPKIINLPAVVNAGELLTLEIASGLQNTASWDPSTPAGWTRLTAFTHVNADAALALYAKVSDGTEGGTTVSITTGYTSTGAGTTTAVVQSWLDFDEANPLPVVTPYQRLIAYPVNIPGIITLSDESIVKVWTAWNGSPTLPITLNAGWSELQHIERANSHACSSYKLDAGQPVAGLTPDLDITCATAKKSAHVIYAIGSAFAGVSLTPPSIPVAIVNPVATIEHSVEGVDKSWVMSVPKATIRATAGSTGSVQIGLPEILINP